VLERARARINVTLAFLHDLGASALAWCLAYWLRFNFEIPEPFEQSMLQALAWAVPVQAMVFLAFGLYRGMWRFASLTDLRQIALAVGVSAAVLSTLLYMAQPQLLVPRSVLIIDPLLLLIFMCGSRLAYRYLREHRLSDVFDVTRKPVLVLGAGEAAEKLIDDLARSQEWRIVGLLDDDPAKQGRDIHGIRVLGALDALPRFAHRAGAEHAIIAMPSVSHAIRRRAADLCAAAGLRVMTVPSFDDLIGGKVTISQIRNIELDDLLGRDPVRLDSAGLSGWIEGNIVMVTGAGGSIGAELCRQVARFRPELLVLFELNEYALYRVEQEFHARMPQVAVACVIGDVRNTARVSEVIARFRPEVVFHAAAYKHVPLMERDNAWEAVQNNVTGTLRLARAAQAHGVAKFVLVSTDKAVNPANVMGATKRLAEMACGALQRESATLFVIVRFGNVIGSTGSVIPKFREQIASGGPITVTHPEVTRYFMSIPEAAQLVLQAGWMGRGGEIYVLEMGAPIKIVDLAREMIRLSGFSETDIHVEFVGLRPGEKLYEEPISDKEQTLPTPHPMLRVARSNHSPGADWLAGLERWLGTEPAPRVEEIKRALAGRVPDYRPERSAPRAAEPGVRDPGER
jgi:FlaA1/EpsC-like NDP-sugar epimerase